MVSKKTKISLQSLPSDPFKVLHAHTHDLILQHFKGNDVITGFEVSPEWNQIIEKSKVGMSQVKLVFDDCQNPTSIREIIMLMDSKRKYQNMKFCINNISNIQRKMKLLSTFGPSLVQLEVFVGELNESAIKLDHLEVSLPVKS